jgi:hypothetical protein
MNMDIKSPVACVFFGTILILIGSIESNIPVGENEIVINGIMKTIFIIFGVLLILFSAVITWKEYSNVHKAREKTSEFNTEELAKEITDELLKEIPFRSLLISKPTSLFNLRKEHFLKEKLFLADQFTPTLLDRCRHHIESGKDVILLIDSGTTLYHLFEPIGKSTVKAHQHSEPWLQNFSIESNNLPGIENLMRSGLLDRDDRYSPLAITCNLLPGAPLPVYSALTGERTTKALKALREDAGEEAIFIAVTTGNWIRLRRSTPVCPVPLARGKGHLEFKQALIDHADETFVVAPLGKIFMDVPPKDVNKALGFSEKSNTPEKHPYHEVNIDNQKAESIKLVSTYRPRGHLLSELSTKVRVVLNVDNITLDRCKQGYQEKPINQLNHLVYKFKDLPEEIEDEVEIEFPHENTRDFEFMRNFFYVDTSKLNRRK